MFLTRRMFGSRAAKQRLAKLYETLSPDVTHAVKVLHVHFQGTLALDVQCVVTLAACCFQGREAAAGQAV